jgi:SAM-dependent methyltransferase
MRVQENLDDTLGNVSYYKTLEALFDRAAKLYDSTYGPPSESGRGNALIGWLQDEFITTLRGVFPEGAGLLDIGSGTGNTALALARAGYSVLGIDISPAMVRQAQTKMVVYGVQRGATFHVLPAGFLRKMSERGPFQGAYSDLGTLNSEPNLAGVARGLNDLLEPGAAFVAVVMSRHCLFENLRRWRLARGVKPLDRSGEWKESRAGAGGVTAPVKFYTPEEFASHFEPFFTVESVCAFPLWMPPLQMHELYNAHPERFRRLEARARRMRTWRGFRNWGDHFLMVLRNVVD